MSLFVSADAAGQLRDIDKNQLLIGDGLHGVLKAIDSDGIDNSSYNIHKLAGTEEEIYVLKYHSLRLFLTKNADGVVLMNILEK